MPSLLGAASPGGRELRAVRVPVVLSPAAAGTWLGNVALVSPRGSNPAGHGRQTRIPHGTEASDQGCCWPSFLPWALPTRWPLEAEPEQLRPLVPWERDRQGGRSVSFPFALGTVHLGGVLSPEGCPQGQGPGYPGLWAAWMKGSIQHIEGFVALALGQ